MSIVEVVEVEVEVELVLQEGSNFNALQPFWNRSSNYYLKIFIKTVFEQVILLR